MSNDILILLCFFDREECFLEPLGATVFIVIVLLVTTFQRGELRVHTHQSSASSHILINKTSDQIHHTSIFRLGSHIQQHYVLWVQISTEALEEPEMRRKLRTIEMLEASEDLQVLSIEILSSPGRVSHSGVPQILIEQGDVLLDGGREVAIVCDIAGHPLATVVINLV